MIGDLATYAVLGLLALAGLTLGLASRWRRTKLVVLLAPVVVAAGLVALFVVADLVNAECHGSFIHGPYYCEPGGETVTTVGWIGLGVCVLTLPPALGAIIGIGVSRLRHRRNRQDAVSMPL